MYQVIRTDNSHVVHRSSFADVIHPGMALELSIVVKRKVFDEIDKACPRCKHDNFNIVADRGWIEWKVLFLRDEASLVLYHNFAAAGAPAILRQRIQMPPLKTRSLRTLLLTPSSASIKPILLHLVAAGS